VNGRTNALRNPLAAMRTPIGLDDYFAARMIRDPLCLLDMDLPVDGADERADAEANSRARRLLLQRAGRRSAPRVRFKTDRAAGA
jgi:hypothetical protein